MTAPPKARYNEAPPPRTAKPTKTAKAQEEESEDEEDEGDDEELSALDSDEDISDVDLDDDEDEDEEDEEDGQESSNPSESEAEEEASSEEEPVAPVKALEEVVANGDQKDRKRKRKDRDALDDLESRYLQALVDDEPEPTVKRQKADAEEPTKAAAADEDDDAASITSASPPPQHESVVADPAAAELDKANRTVFLSNVASAAITSRTAKRTLLAHLSTVLDKTASPPQIIESIRFRSTAFAGAGVPKRAAYIKKEVMDATTRSTNAYAVYSDPRCARLAAARLNGAVVLDRHVRVDCVAHPAPVAHRRCVFVGNLGFVDDETVVHSKDGTTEERKKRNKAPADVEEGLWRVFGDKAGKVESVRVVRDPATRVGKGFAYVQFYVRSYPLPLPASSPSDFHPTMLTAWKCSRTRTPSSPRSYSTRSRSRPCCRARCA